MRQTLLFSLLISFLVLLMIGCQRDSNPLGTALADGPSLAGKPAECNGPSIQDGVLFYSAGHFLEGQPLTTGYDPFGYNYQAHMFKGSYANAYLGRDGLPPYEGDADSYLAENLDAADHWVWPYRDIELTMKWNDAWLSNKDCDENEVLDRHYPYNSPVGSGAWLTNHQSGIVDGKKRTYFVKIVAAPLDATTSGESWYAADDTEIGPVIWGSYAIIQEQGYGFDFPIPGEISRYVSPAGPGFGKFKK